MKSVFRHLSFGCLVLATIVAHADELPLNRIETFDDSVQLKVPVFYRVDSEHPSIPVGTREAIARQLKLLQDDYKGFQGNVIFQLKEVAKPAEGQTVPHAKVQEKSDDRLVIEFPYSSNDSAAGHFGDFYFLDPKVEHLKATVKEFEDTRKLITTTVPNLECPPATYKEKPVAKKPKPKPVVREVKLIDNGPGCEGPKKVTETTVQTGQGDFHASLLRYYGVSNPPTVQAMAEVHALWSLWGNHHNNGKSRYYNAACKKGTFSRLVSVEILKQTAGAADPKKPDPKTAQSIGQYQEGKWMGFPERITIECCVK